MLEIAKQKTGGTGRKYKLAKDPFYRIKTKDKRLAAVYKANGLPKAIGDRLDLVL